MRIVTGSARGTNIKTLEGTDTRPTASVVKEAMFSMIQFEIEGTRVLDLFSGSGQLGLEALSRGADYAVMCDSNPKAVDIIKQNAQKAKLYEHCSVLKTDYMGYLKNIQGREKFNLVFLDPPYASDYYNKSVNLLLNGNLLAPNAIIVMEGEFDAALNYPALKLRRFAKYGRTSVTVYDYVTDAEL